MLRALLCLAIVAGVTPLGRAEDELQLVDERDMLVEVSFDEDSRPLLTVRARNVSAEALTRRIARELRLSNVYGFDDIDAVPTVSVHLERRPPNQSLRWILGSVGISATIGENSIQVASDVGLNPDAKAMLRKAGTRYFDALRRFPDYPTADRAEMARAEIHERLGEDEWPLAILSYDRLIEEYPRSEYIPEATLRSARLHAHLGAWNQAILRYEELGSSQDPHPYHTVARLELAESLCKSGEGADNSAVATAAGQRATYVLDALDMNYPTQDPAGRFERLLVRSRAQALAGQPIRALQSLDAAMGYSSQGKHDARVLELRAICLARAGEHSAASSAWLLYAESGNNADAAKGYLNAAQEALVSGEEIAVMLIHARAEDLGVAQPLLGTLAEARARLGLAIEGTAGLDPLAGLASGESHVTARRWDAAIEALRPVYRRKDDLKPDDRVRLAKAYARALHKSGHEEAAIDVVRALVATLEKRTQRQTLYLLAADLYEDRDAPRLDLAVEALKGRL